MTRIHAIVSKRCYGFSSAVKFSVGTNLPQHLKSRPPNVVRTRAGAPLSRTANHQKTVSLRMEDGFFSISKAPAEQMSALQRPLGAVAITACRRTENGTLQWLMIQRGKAPSKGEWSLPGGSVELGEQTLDAAKRELLEETGIAECHATFSQDPFMCSDNIIRDSSGKMLFHYIIAQIFAVVDPAVPIVAGDDAMDAGWFTAEEIEAERCGRVTDNVARVVRRADQLRRAGCLPIDAAELARRLGPDGLAGR